MAFESDDYEVTKRLHATMDAQVWAQEWCRIAREIEAADDGRTLIDEGWMIGWFANAIMVGWDEHARRYPEPPYELMEGWAEPDWHPDGRPK